MGTRAATWLGRPLPLDIDPLFGSKGNSLHVAPIIAVPFRSTASGGAVINLPIPAAAVSRAAHIYVQGLVFQGTFMGRTASTTPGLDINIQP
jgi:hypothetical protein